MNSFEVRKHCYEKIGKRCIIKTKDQEVFKKYTAIFAINNRGLIGYEIYKKGGINSIRLKEFLNKFITTIYKKKLIILDNASSHRNESIKEQITKNNELLYTVPYQHYTNAIENFFSIFKNKLRKFNDIGLIKLEDNIKKIINVRSILIFYL